jgi:hypothetical protein
MEVNTTGEKDPWNKRTPLVLDIDSKNKRLIVRKTGDITDIEGAFAHKAIKNKSIDEIIKIENQAIEDGWIERSTKKNFLSI